MKTLLLKPFLRTFDGIFDLYSSEHHLPEIFPVSLRSQSRLREMTSEFGV